MEENLKIKRLLKKTLENKEFESSFEDDVTSWNDDETIYEEYSFKYFMEVGKVLGKGYTTVASVNVIITDIQKDGDDFYYDWADNYEYSEYTWYIGHLETMLHEDMVSDFPISIHLTFYGYDEYENLSDQQKNL
jgi:hypothetical protein